MTDDQRQTPDAQGPAHPESAAAVAALPPSQTGLADGEWHRLHPLTPLLRGGIAFVAIVGVILANLRERAIEWIVGAPGYEGDPVDFVMERGWLGIGLLIALGVILLLIAGFYLSWRFHSFRIDTEVVEVRSGVVFRTNRKARLDRVQGVNVSRPLLPRVFGTAKLEITQAGDDANVALAYLSGAQTDALRSEILRLASGTKRAAAQQAQAAEQGGAQGGVLDRRVHEFLAPELDPTLAPEHSVVRVPVGRLLGSVATSGTTLIFVLLVAGLSIAIAITGEAGFAFGIVPSLLGLGGYLVSRVTRSLRYSIAGTPDGVRIGSGLLTTQSDTLPPGRIHSVSINQGPIWRLFGWWQVTVNRASRTSGNSSQAQLRAIVLPVGTRADAERVLALLLPGLTAGTLVAEGLESRGDDRFVNSPPRARWVRWFSQRRNGFALLPDVALLRRGQIFRELVVVPLPRVQSVGLTRGVVARGLRLVNVHLHTVAGPISARLGAIDRDAGTGFAALLAERVVGAGSSDTSQRWRSGEAA